MARHRFRLFGNLSFLQSMDKERILSRLLTMHRDYFTRQGLDVDALTNDDASARQLLAVFTKPDEKMPGDLLRDLYVLDEVADEDGHQRILEEAELRGIDLRSFPDDVSPGDFATLVLVDHPHLVRICHEKTIARQVKRYYEYRSRDSHRFEMADAESGVDAIKATLGPWFEERKRTRTCELGDVPIRVEIWSAGVARLNKLRDLGLLFKVEVDGMLGLMGKQGGPQDRQPLVSLEPSEAFGGLQHGGPGPA